MKQLYKLTAFLAVFSFLFLAPGTRLHAQKIGGKKSAAMAKSAEAKPAEKVNYKSSDAQLKASTWSAQKEEVAKPSEKLVLFMAIDSPKEQIMAFEELRVKPELKIAPLESKENCFVIIAPDAKAAERLAAAYPELELYTPQQLQKISGHIIATPSLAEGNISKLLNQF